MSPPFTLADFDVEPPIAEPETFDVEQYVEPSPRPAAPELPDTEAVGDELAALGPDMLATKRRSRELVKVVAGATEDPETLLNWRDFLKAYGGLPGGEFDTIAKQVTEDRAAEREALAAEERRERHAVQLADAIDQGGMLPSPANPLAVARRLMESQPRTDGHFHRAWWRDDHYAWTGTHWRIEKPATIRKWLYSATEHATYDGGEVKGVQPWQPDRDKVNKVLDALSTAVIQRCAEDEAEQVMACLNGVFDLETGLLLPHSPTRFNLHVLPYDYDPTATCPKWMEFLNQVLPATPDVPPEVQAQQFIKEWFGYCVSGRIDLEKMASLVGGTRCGKGTIGRVLKALLGADAVVAPTIDGMSGPFGEEGFIGKSLAIMGDVRWNGRNIGAAVPILLAITGEDHHDVHRKNRTPWSGTLGLRFMTMQNDPPTFNDASGALNLRMIQVEFTQSFEGKEDSKLTPKLLAELPGILNWALDGLRSLTARGHFVEPACGADVAEQVRRLSSPESAFVEDRCDLGADHEVTLQMVYQAYRGWCVAAGKDYIPPKEIFSRNLQSAYRGKVKTIRVGPAKEYRVRGLQLKKVQS